MVTHNIKTIAFIQEVAHDTNIVQKVMKRYSRKNKYEKNAIIRKQVNLDWRDVEVIAERMIEISKPVLPWEEKEEETEVLRQLLEQAILSFCRRKAKRSNIDILKVREKHIRNGLKLKVRNHHLQTGRLRRYYN